MEEVWIQVYIEDSLGERIWVDSPHCKTFVDNIQTAFNTKMPPKSMLLHGEVGRSGGDLSAGSSPHPSMTEEEDSQSELLIAEEKMSPEQEGQLMPRYDDLVESVEEYVLDMLRDQLNRRQPMDNVSRNLLRLLTATCGYKEVRQMAVQRLEMWLQNPKLTKPAQDLLMSVCMNCNTHSSEDMEVISNLIKIRLKPKVLLNHYMLCIRELLNAHRDNLGTTIKFVIFNELSNARNPNNMQILYTVLQHSSEQAPKVLFTEQPETYYKWDNWPPESDRNFFLRLCSEVPILEDTLMRILVIGLSRDLPLGPADAMELADHLILIMTSVGIISCFSGRGPPRRPPPHVLEQVKSLNQSLRLGHLLCRSRHPDFLLNIIQRQASSQSMPWLADLVQSSEGSLDVLPVQCLCEFLLHDAADESTSGEEEEEGESKEQRAKKRQRQQKQRQLLGRLQDLLLGPKADEQTTCEVLDYFLRRLSSSQVASRVLAMKGLSLVLSEGGLRDGEEKDHPMEEDSGDSELLQGYQWLLRDLPRLPLFDSVRATTALALQQAIHMETDPQTISAYLVYLSQHAPVEEQGQHNDLALDVARLIVERSTIMSHLFSKLSYCAESDAVLVALLSIFSRYIKRMRQSKEGEEVYSWSESQDQVFLRWTSGETATMHILVVHAMVILLTLGPPQAGDGDFYTLLDIWFPEKKPLPTAFLVDTSEEALLLPDWLKLRMIRSEVPRLVDAALQDLEPQQLLLFVQSFGIPVSSMSKLLQYLDQAVSHDPQTLEQNIMDKNYMAHLVEVQHERGATGGQTFHSLLTASLPARRDSAETARAKSSPENSQGQSRIRALSQVRVLGPEDDLAGIFLQLFPLNPDPRWQNSNLRPLALALQQALGQELARIRQGNTPVTGISARLLQAVAALLNSPHSGALVMAMHRNHFISCPLMRQLYQYQRCMPQDTAFSSLFFKVLMQMLQWLENPAVEDGPLRAQLKAFAVQYSSRHRISDVRGGFLHLTEALTFRRDPDLISSTVRAIIATLKSGEKCNVEPELISKVLQGLIETHSPYLEELLTVLFSATVETTARFPAMKPIAVVSSLLLQDKEETPVKKELDSCSTEAPWLGPSSGLLNDWLEMLDPEVISSCPDLQQKLLFSWNKAGSQVPSFRPYLLALLTHQSSWTTLHQCIRLLLCRNREQRFDPTASLDFLWACIHIPRIWQGRDQRTPQKRREEFVLHLKASELISMVELILAEAETRYQNTEEASCTLIQSRLPLLLSCSHGDLESIKKVTEYLTSCIQQWGSSSVGKCCQDLLLQIYLQLPELLVPMPEMLLTSEGARDSSTCKNYRKSSRHLAAFISKFVQFIHKYITCNAQAAVSFLQKHSDPLHDLSSDNSDLAMLKSLLAGLSLPSKSGVLDRGSDEEKEDEAAAGSLPLVSVSLFTPLTPAEMAPYMKRLSRGQTVEEHAAVLLHRAFLVGMYGQIDTSSQISEALKVLHMEAMI
ncbi:hypothetical protein llap_15580 [Limosa lapponica baueri]|uniref:Uncharacterized protein n=1 Tax=Limosa lapponica baueri TaxID=1758121 RepID=A0A2I0TJZ3_LIMLA|nr:hypothetical protein llap_15580 [Limosa lapponica baueri]